MTEDAGPRPRLRVLIVAAYASMRAGLHALLVEEDDLAIVAEVGSEDEAGRILPETRPDAALFDDSGGGLDRIAALLADTDTALVALGDDRSGFRALADRPLRGWAYLTRETEGADIAAAVRAAAAGLIVIDRSLAPLVAACDPSLQPARADTAPDARDELTPREREVLQLIAQGLPNKTIAARLGISMHTVKFHVAAILAKLDAASRTEAVTQGARRGYVSL